MGQLLPTILEIWAALNQAGILLAAGLLLGLGVLLFANRLYWRVCAKRVRGNVVGVRAPRKYFYYPVYRYRMTPTSRWLEATADVGSLPNPDLVTGHKVRLLVFRKFPDRVADAGSYLLEIVGTVFFVTGCAGIAAACAFWPITPLTWVMLGVILIFVIYLLRRCIPRWREPPFSSITRGWRPAELLESPAHPIEDLLSGPVRAERQRKQRATARIVTPALVLLGLGVVALGVYLGRSTFLLQSHGERTHGTVVFLELKTTLHGSTYYPVVQFATREGTAVQFRDGMGSNPPAYREGDPVNVLYSRNLPERTATIDRGILDWLAPGILCAMGSALAGIAFWARLGVRD
jgi:hypothetical protein